MRSGVRKVVVRVRAAASAAGDRTVGVPPRHRATREDTATGEDAAPAREHAAAPAPATGEDAATGDDHRRPRP